MLFNIFSSDIDSGIKYILIKFVDDNKLCDKVKMTEGWDATPRDLDSLCQWDKEKLMRFKKSKCKVLHMGNGNHQYKLKDVRTENSPATMGIGILVNSKWT